MGKGFVDSVFADVFLYHRVSAKKYSYQDYQKVLNQELIRIMAVLQRSYDSRRIEYKFIQKQLNRKLIHTLCVHLA